MGYPIGTPARRAALRLIDAVARRGETVDQALAAATQGLDDKDRALARALASEVFRHASDLDRLIDSATRMALAPDAKARMVLRIALVSALKLKTPPHAAIATALPLVSGGPRRLVHGVFGSVMRSGAALPCPPNLPEPFAGRWRAHWGEAMVAQAQTALGDAPPLGLALRDPTEETAIVAAMAVTGVEVTRLAPGLIQVPRGTRLEGLPGFAEGAWWVQNAASALPVRLLGPGEGRTVLDLCAAPGGKTMQLAAAGWRVTALDRDDRRLARLRANLARTGLTAAVVAADVLDWAPPHAFDAILLDAPCSATGTFARHPDVLARVRLQDLPGLAATQLAMLRQASGWLAPGGRLIYATCSLEPEEGEAVVTASGLGVVAPNAGQFVGMRGDLPLDVSAQGWLRVLPEAGLDGFFVAELRAP